MATRLTGGCQCGAVRYAITAAPTGVSLCHCRMCQKATGGAFLASASVPLGGFAWTRGAPAAFDSSSMATRDFCAACGTPLAWRMRGEDRISIGLGTLDSPGSVAPDVQLGVESRLAWWPSAHGLPARTTAEDSPAAILEATSFQHPDHDTGDDWRPPAR